MRSLSFRLIILLVFVLLDFYIYFAIRTSFFSYSSQRNKNIFTIVYWTVSILTMILLIITPQMQSNGANRFLKQTFFTVIFALFLGKMIASFFFIIDDLRRLAQWIGGKLFSGNTEIGALSGADSNGISRSSFLTWIGIVAGGGMFTTLIYGTSNKYNYHIKKVPLSFASLPQAFKGLKIIQISDIHCGSFNNKAAVNKGINMILNEKPDLILFTGDLVNNRSVEMEDYMDTFSRLTAPLGVYSILGNHDYGDYEEWNSLQAKEANLAQLKLIHAKLGWRLMLDEHLPIEKDGGTIGLIGVQNISGKIRFHSYGNLQNAMQGAENYPFKILMSHDPSHWDKEVNSSYTDIDLTLSGHTHGMQFGVEIPGFRWSPVQYVYKQWAGLYEKGKQKLYVNRGFGFIGYAGRVGILPEITVFELS